jgi:hypothetical protein
MSRTLWALGPGVFVSEDALTPFVDNFLGSQDINKFLNCSRVAGKPEAVLEARTILGCYQQARMWKNSPSAQTASNSVIENV